MAATTYNTFVKKTPDHQAQAMAKIRPLTLLYSKEARGGQSRAGQRVQAATTKLFQDKLRTLDDYIKKVKTYQNYEELQDVYIQGESKLKREVETAMQIPEPQRKLVVLNESIGKQTFSSLTLRGTYAKVANKVPPEINPEDEELNSSRTGKEERPSQQQQKRRTILVVEDGEEEEIIAMGTFDKKNIVY
jgi:hypothetical protein